MGAHRFVLVSAALVSLGVANQADARPRLPAVFGAVLGAVGGVVGLHAYHRHHHHHAVAARDRASRVAAHTPEETGKTTEQPSVEGNAAAAGQIAAPAPLVWPHLPEDLADYLFRPSGTDDPFWSYGYAEVIDGAFGAMSRRPERLSASARAQATTAVASAGGAAPGTCPTQQGAGLADGFVDRIEQTIAPTDAQKAAVDALRVAARHGFEYFDSSCPSDQPQSPASRLDAMEDRIWAARQALLILRAPIDTLYASLSDEQKARLNGPAVPPDQPEATCAKTMPELPLAQLGLGRGARPTEEQRTGANALKTTSAMLAKTVAASCPASMPATPVGRLDAADKRLNALLYSVVTLRAPLDALSASLNEAQKRRPSARR